MPLLDEAAELLGEDDTAARLAARAAGPSAPGRAGVRPQVRAVGLGGGRPRSAPSTLADRFADAGPTLTVAERAEPDRTWAYGHVVVDEAQELSAMTWRLLMRRCPPRSMTLVGDIAQAGALAGALVLGGGAGPVRARTAGGSRS